MNWKAFFAVIFALVAIGLLFFYEFAPLVNNQFQMTAPVETRFNVGVYNPNNMQFYPNMRFPDKLISYSISPSCDLQKKAETKSAFDILSNLTNLNFYLVNSNEEILITCQEKDVMQENGLFVAGEGGPTKIIKTQNFNVILNGKVLLLRNSDCQSPNIAIHELLHVLGFAHSTNKGSIMYSVSQCNQLIGEDLVQRINELYSVESYSDLAIENASAIVHGMYLDVNMSINNEGLRDSQNAKVEIYTNNKLAKEFDLGKIPIGHGEQISLGNIPTSERNVQQIKILINTTQPEISKTNNEVVLEIKK